jgi:hypothetical protein
LILSNFIRLRAFAETEIALTDLPNETPTLLRFAVISGVGKVKKDYELLFIPAKSRFFAALCLIALARESSSDAGTTSSPTPWRVLRRDGVTAPGLDGATVPRRRAWVVTPAPPKLLYKFFPK